MANISYRVRNCFTLANVSALSIGGGLLVIGWFAPIAFPDVSQGTALFFFYVGVVFISLGLVMAGFKYFRNPIEKRLKVFDIIGILYRMYGLLEEMACKKSKKEVDQGKFQETADKIIKLSQVSVPKVSSTGDARTAIDELEKELPSIFPADKDTEQKVRKMLSISRLADKDGWGLKTERMKPKKYAKMLKLVDKYYDENRDFVDENLRVCIRCSIAFNEAASNFLLYMLLAKPQFTLATELGILPPSLEADIEGFEDDTKEIARKLYIKVGDEIRSKLSANTANLQPSVN